MGRLGAVDPSSYSQSELVTTEHSVLKWKVDFERTKLIGSVIHRFNIFQGNLSKILLDVRDLVIYDVNIISENSPIPLNYFISDSIDNVGAKLTLELPDGIPIGKLCVEINYETSSTASALLWLTPEQTLGKQQPFMFSQCQALQARSIVPCQDTPAVKFTYEATVEHSKDLTALMSAIIVSKGNGITTFQQNVPIPSYLYAIAVGKLVSKCLGSNSNVWAEEQIINECAEEFSQTSEMLKIAQDICGPYVWQQYDLLVMPPSFPLGAMENPCLTFVTPTILVGDKSMVDCIAHEISHSWTGNLVTNKNFEHYWLNEGFTVFIEEKIVGRLLGSKERDFHAVRNLTDLKDCLHTQLSNNPELTKLVVDLSNCSPDDAFSLVPYVKGSTFLRYIEDLVGGPTAFEPFLKSYLQKFAYKSITTDDFKTSLYEYFSKIGKEEKLDEINWNLWLYGIGMPPIIPKLDESLSNTCNKLSLLWSSKTYNELLVTGDIKQKISAHQLINVLGKLIDYDEIVDLTEQKIELLVETYDLRNTKNAEITFRLMRLYIKAKLLNRLDEILQFVNSMFRMKFCRPIYHDLAGWKEVKSKAITNFELKKSLMMPLCSHTISNDLGLI